MAADGVSGFYKGLDSALLRQAVYATLRLGIYFNLTEKVKKDMNNGANLSALQKAGCSLTAGCLGSFIGNPCDLALVRMQADATLPEAERRNYKNVFDAFSRTLAEEGVTGLWRGSIPTMMRASSLNIAMLVSYEEVKERLTALYGPDQPRKIQLSASLVSAVCTACASLPFDNMKTKMQK
mmetsp:Transcript_9070/g.6415  ORF Transcript_9070/g.6415 Transcript_9070/m.6415 type:complete len:181 (+) Transcript_9070:263-805(+)|eukprot:CAMPEP_0116881628 /NCGR_PEP_ID=MMETSP0463-20121206/13709_1 /TAXON_ID=181622 /ORGANISM="Strombidinopsis sp, Strain SopsisLIS2011" /LENGTH=180 /DNA_ID=CAMNT_0004533701 /DNA_START=298 /DNA_END=840 /DNA_ORIENTATION=+